LQLARINQVRQCIICITADRTPRDIRQAWRYGATAMHGSGGNAIRVDRNCG
jgi:hypothetical protein